MRQIVRWSTTRASSWFLMIGGVVRERAIILMIQEIDRIQVIHV